jgi:hypothetical protein
MAEQRIDRSTFARRTVTTIVYLVLLTTLVVSPAAAEDHVSGVELLKHLSGTWKAAEERTPRATALDAEVFGPGAFDVRNVTLVIQPSGEGDLQVHTWVVGGKGRTFAPSVIEVRLRIAEPVASAVNHIQPAVSVISADERYLDGAHEHWAIEGARITLTLTGLTSMELNLQFDTQNGRGGFGTSLTRRHDGPRSQQGHRDPR